MPRLAEALCSTPLGEVPRRSRSSVAVGPVGRSSAGLVASARKSARAVSMRLVVVKQLRVTLVGVGLQHVVADVSLHRTSTWSASAKVEHNGLLVQHTTVSHASDREALASIAEWLRKTFRASATCLGSTVTIVGVSQAQSDAA
jgi:hypothetical protein